MIFLGREQLESEEQESTEQAPLCGCRSELIHTGEFHQGFLQHYNANCIFKPAKLLMALLNGIIYYRSILVR